MGEEFPGRTEKAVDASRGPPVPTCHKPVAVLLQQD